MSVYRALLRLFPTSFRVEYGEEMCAVFGERRRATSGALATIGLWVEILFDIPRNAAGSHWDVLRQDVRYTARTLRAAPGFTMTAILLAALGVGATTATFSITDHVLLRPLPLADPESLIKLYQNDRKNGYGRTELSPGNYRDWKSLSASFATMAAYTNQSLNLVGEGDPERLNGAAFTAEMLSVLGVRPLLGRGFTAEDEQPGGTGTLLLSYRLWQRRFGADRAVLGRRVLLDGEPHVIIGVMPRGFLFPSRDAELWTAMRLVEQDFEDRRDCYLYGMARLRPGVSLEQARSGMELLTAQLEREYPAENEQMGATVLRLRDEVSVQARMLLAALFGAALCVLLIACTNLASLLLARSAIRHRELAVRTALGAGRERLVRQMLTESLILAGGGGMLGVLLALVATPLVATLAPHSLPIAAAPASNLRVLIFAAAMTVITAVGFGMAPALHALRSSSSQVGGLREGARAGVGTRRRQRLRSALVACQVALTVVLLVAAGLFLRALWRLEGTDPGFRSDGILTLRTALPMPKYVETSRRAQFYERVLAEIRELPEVSSAAYISFLPMVMRGGIWEVEIAGKTDDPAQSPKVSLRFVTPDFFRTLEIPIVAGRDVSDADLQDSPFVAVVSDSFVKRFWPEEQPLGRSFRVAFAERTVVGVVGDIRVRGLEQDSEPQVYLPHTQVPDDSLVYYAPKDLVVRSAEPGALLPQIRAIVGRADPQQPISDTRTLADVVAAETAPRSLQARVLGGFAALALLLAAIGLHGLLAFAVSSRVQEIGVRMALGAERRDVLALILRQGALLALSGAALGLTLAFGTSRILEAVLAGISPYDATVFLVATTLAIVVAMAGSLLPAVRAAQVDPLRVMRTE